MFFLLLVSLALSGLISHRYMFMTPLSGVQIISLYFNDAFLSFSGRKSSIDYSEGLKIYTKDLRTNTYKSSKSYSQIYPQARSHYGLAWAESRWVYLFGGIGSRDVFGDLWVYDIELDTWNIIYESSEISPRFDFAYTTVLDELNNSTLFAIAGGTDHIQGLQDFYIINITSRNSIEILTMAPLNDECFDFPLTGGQLQYVNEKIYLFSGNHKYLSDESSYFQGLCEFSLENNKWKSLFTKNSLIRSVQGGSFVYENSIYYYFGKNNEGFIKGIYKLDLSNIKNGWETIEINHNCERSEFGYTSILQETNINYVMFAFGSTPFGYANSEGFIYFDADGKIGIKCSYNIKNSVPRSKASISQISDSLLLFGGTNAGKFFNDIWKANYTSDINLYNWTLIEAIGNSPSPRMAHAASSQGHFVLVVGGINEKKNYLSDYWLLDTENSNFKWIELLPLSNSPIPSALAHSCAILDIPYFYIIGGESSDYLSQDIWRYDMSENVFVKAQFNEKIPQISRHGCYLDRSKKSIYIIFGSLNFDNKPSQEIRRINITNFPYVSSTLITFSDPVPGRSNFGYSVINSTIFVAGGQEYFSKSYKDVWAIDIQNLQTFRLTQTTKSGEKVFELDTGLHSMSFGTVAGKFIIYSGTQGNGELLQQESSDSIYMINIISYPQYQNHCGLGSFFNGTFCIPCKRNTYKDGNSILCKGCPSGTYINSRGSTDILQCLPCSFGYFAAQSLNSFDCIKCNSDKICFIGADHETDYTAVITLSQPKLIEPASNLMFVYILFSITGVLLILFILFWAPIKRLRIWLSVNDFYKDDHIDPPVMASEEAKENNEVENQNLPQANFIGGFFTGASLIIFISVLAYYIYIYANGNTSENITLTSSSNMISDKNFDKVEIIIYIEMFSLRNFNCKKSEIQLKNSPFFYGISTSRNLTTISKNHICTFKIRAKKSKVIQSGDFIQLTLPCANCYTSDISVAVESNSAYHSMKSRAVNNITLTDGNILIGKSPSRFFFELSPSLFDDLTSTNKNKVYGYRVSSILSPELGTTSDLSSIYLNSKIKVKVEFTLSRTGVYTIQMLKQDNFGYIGMAVGALSGTIGMIAILMKIGEFVYIKIKFWKKKTMSKYKIFLNTTLKKRDTTKVNPNESSDLNQHRDINDDVFFNQEAEKNNFINKPIDQNYEELDSTKFINEKVIESKEIKNVRKAFD